MFRLKRKIIQERRRWMQQEKKNGSTRGNRQTKPRARVSEKQRIQTEWDEEREAEWKSCCDVCVSILLSADLLSLWLSWAQSATCWSAEDIRVYIYQSKNFYSPLFNLQIQCLTFTSSYTYYYTRSIVTQVFVSNYIVFFTNEWRD